MSATPSALNQPPKEAGKVGQFFEARGRREVTDQRPTVNLYLPHQQGTSPYYLLEVEDAERLGVALLQEAGLARKAATLLSESPKHLDPHRHGDGFGWHAHEHTHDGSPDHHAPAEHRSGLAYGVAL